MFGRFIAIILLLVPSTLAQAGLIVANSVEEFSSVQGQNGWYYGYIEPDSGPDLLLMSDYSPELGWWTADTDRYWTTLYALGGHPNGVLPGKDRDPIEHWAVRRWISEVGGPIEISGKIAKNTSGGGGFGGNGIVASILVDGFQVWSQYVGAFDTHGFDYRITTDATVGSSVDFVIKPYLSDDLADDTRFTATIAAVPEPSMFTMSIIGGLGLVGYRWFSRSKHQRVRSVR